jgi:glycosyltransferase involved in cell wall biosynthesis/MoaA/NifB/PqqE/SkfB family radical SAM enzyme
MRILMIHPHDIYSPQEPWTVRITYLAQEFVARGHEVKLVYHLQDPTALVQEMAARQEYPFSTIPMIRYSFTLARKVVELRQLARWADVLHFQKCFSYVAIPSVVAGYLAGIPVHYDWDDWEYEIFNYRPQDAREGRLIDVCERTLPRLVDTISVASEALRQMCLALGVPSERIFEGHVGGDLKAFSPNTDGSLIRARHDLDGLVVMYLGQLHGAQYCELFLQAAREVLVQRDDVTFMVVGTGDRLGELHQLAESLQISHRLVFTGAVPHAEVPQYLAAADVVVACFADTPQVRCKSPLKICEYMAAGKAIVASEVGEAARMVRGVGVLARPSDPSALAQGILTLLDDRALREELGHKARQRAEQEYNWGVTAESLLRAYQFGIEERRRRFRLRAPEPQSRALDWLSRPPTTSLLSGDFIRQNLDLIGILDGESAFVGPRLVQLDVTNNCNNDCIACWANSPLLGETRIDENVKRQTLPLEKIEALLDELSLLGTQDIYMAGGGEPCMHPRFDEVIQAIKARGFCLFINTNFTLVEEARADLLVDLQVDHLTVSTWAGTPEVYARTHPNKTEETFEQMREMLTRIARRKGQRGLPPLIKLYNVISHLNYQDVEAMIDFALQVQAESVEFTVVDTMPGYTDCLLLDDNQRAELYQRCRAIGQRVVRDKLPLDLFRFDQFLRRISDTDSTTGNYDRQIIDTLPCTIGWTFARIMPDGNVDPCLKAHRYPLGNIYEASFREVWNSPRQHEFRQQANQLKKRGPVFRLIGNDPGAEVGCYRGCDDLGRNQHIHGRLEALSHAQRMALRLAGRYLRARGKYL